jgi:hypothetical protein
MCGRFQRWFVEFAIRRTVGGKQVSRRKVTDCVVFNSARRTGMHVGAPDAPPALVSHFAPSGY